MKPIEAAFGKAIIFSREGEISKGDRDKCAQLGSLYSCRVPRSSREQLRGMEPVVAFPSNMS